MTREAEIRITTARLLHLAREQMGQPVPRSDATSLDPMPPFIQRYLAQRWLICELAEAVQAAVNGADLAPVMNEIMDAVGCITIAADKEEWRRVTRTAASVAHAKGRGAQQGMMTTVHRTMAGLVDQAQSILRSKFLHQWKGVGLGH